MLVQIETNLWVDVREVIAIAPSDQTQGGRATIALRGGLAVHSSLAPDVVVHALREHAPIEED